MQYNYVICQSGGPTSVINASLYGVLKNAKSKVYGARYGITGIINDNLIDLSEYDYEGLQYTPSAFLGSARYNLSKEEDYQKIVKNCLKYNIKYILINGGNDSMDTVDKLANYFKTNSIDINVMGIPKTIDNDLAVTDHSPGYGSAIKFIANTVSQIKLDTSSYEKGRVTIVEIMGRDAGWLAAGSKLASLVGNGPDLIYLPEVSFDKEQFLSDVKKIYEKNKKVLVCVSEGIKNKEGKYLLREFLTEENNDVFGHLQLGGCADVLSKLVCKELKYPVRTVILELPQRCSVQLASLTDIKEAIECGKKAVEEVITETGKVVIMNRVSEYKINYESVEVNKIANLVKAFPIKWIINNNDIAKEFIDYALPLINGEPALEFHNGLLVFKKIS